MFIWQTYNALFMIRNVVKYFAEYLKGDDFAKQFTPQVQSKWDACAGTVMKMSVVWAYE